MLGLKKHSLTSLIFAFLGLFLLSGCTSMQVNHSNYVRLCLAQPVVVLPFTNMTETPQADERATAILTDLLRTKGMRYVASYPSKMTKPSLIPGVKPTIPRAKMLAWAREQGFSYAFIGSVTEWNYKVGLDGEPAIGVNIDMVNLRAGIVEWSAVGSKSGGSRTALSEVAITLINAMLHSIDFKMVRRC